MGEAFFWALEARLQACEPRSCTAPAPSHDGRPLPGQGAAGDDVDAGTCANPISGRATLGDERAGEQDGVAMSRAEFEALVGQELRIFAYNRPHHALDFRIACSCAISSICCQPDVPLGAD